MNFTVKAPPDGKYCTDVFQVGEEYKKWRKNQIYLLLMVLLVWVVWADALKELYPWRSLIGAPYTTLMGLVDDLCFAGIVFIVIRFLLVKPNFECPFCNCRTAMRIHEPWECSQCRDDKVTIPILWFRTFFDKCKNDHKPESFLCPTCEEEGRTEPFELIPGGRKDKPAKGAVVTRQTAQQPSLPKQEEVKTGELITKEQAYKPRDFLGSEAGLWILVR